ncbi:type II toxin-antitoxin system VapB family antitoxin [Stackebrandtia nassauensis]|uniref:Uncharacterized protein n=1 Tax=Stackebrandtia nassauensis (strain DSM 44728 / CIP 108903 / NRRL B-16338 / NBRC 102104 / LLR-40K-21) TaxID=446470 RepID=D3Q0Z5_STANL|nr:type II toxin-antitoxin system VapB family antitoxin [Stackebrandtia nassauensis]ADD43745.1 conserved hypothetical protein [Stackebrandtia nassauensis DSM 44728]
MSVTSLNIDEGALAAVLRLSGVRTKRDAVNLALREYAERHERIAALERYADMAQEWDHESWREQHEMEKRGE